MPGHSAHHKQYACTTVEQGHQVLPSEESTALAVRDCSESKKYLKNGISVTNTASDSSRNSLHKPVLRWLEAHDIGSVTHVGIHSYSTYHSMRYSNKATNIQHRE